jgi:hypothetical protein
MGGTRKAVIRFLLLVALVAGTPTPTWGATYYRLVITRIDRDLYRDQASRALVQTRACYEDAERDPALLRWDGPTSTGNKLIFSSGLMCEVTELDERGPKLTPDERLSR